MLQGKKSRNGGMNMSKQSPETIDGAFRTHNEIGYFNSNEYKKDVYTVFNSLLAIDRSKKDLTSSLLFKNQPGQCRVIAKESGILAGMHEVRIFLSEYFPAINSTALMRDGDHIKKGDHLLILNGDLAAIFSLERVLLDILQRLCGIATKARAYSGTPNGITTLLCSTRKTVLGSLEKRAAWIGGIHTHRMNLSKAVMVKNNQIKALNNDYKHIFKILLNSSKAIKSKFIEIEANNTVNAKRIISNWKCYDHEKRKLYLLLDNMPVNQVKNICNYIRKSRAKVIVEVSGGITLKNLRSYLKSGATIISIGDITTNVKHLDLALRYDSSVQ